MASTRAPPEARSRFTRTERAAHWLLAATFFVMLFTGLCLSVSAFEGILDRPDGEGLAPLERGRARGRPRARDTLLGDRRSLARSAREIDRFDADDGALAARRRRGRVLNGRPAPPQGRFNAGQKLNAALIGGLMLAMYVTGFLLWYGERDTTYRFAGTVIVHDWAHADPDVPGRRAPLPRGAPPSHAPRPARHDARRRGRDVGAQHHAKWVEPDAPSASGRRDRTGRRPTF